MVCRTRTLSFCSILLIVACLASCGRRSKENAVSQQGPISFNLSAITGSNQPQMFSEVKDASVLPKAVLDQFPGGMASPGQPFDTTDIHTGRPHRMLAAAAISRQYCIVSYWHGGIAFTFQTAIFELSDGKARLIWYSPQQGGFNFLDLKKMVESGRMRNDQAHFL